MTSDGSGLTLPPIANFEVLAQQSNKTVDQIQREFDIFREALTLYQIQKAIDPNLPQHTENNNANPRQYASRAAPRLTRSIRPCSMRRSGARPGQRRYGTN